jgi:hypothetical protein
MVERWINGFKPKKRGNGALGERVGANDGRKLDYRCDLGNQGKAGASKAKSKGRASRMAG